LSPSTTSPLAASSRMPQIRAAVRSWTAPGSGPDTHTMSLSGLAMLRLSLQLWDEFGNGEQLYAQAGEVIARRERSTVPVASFSDATMT
jgi:hypothetical protein